jgi:hypothetical protein
MSKHVVIKLYETDCITLIFCNLDESMSKSTIIRSHSHVHNEHDIMSLGSMQE